MTCLCCFFCLGVFASPLFATTFAMFVPLLFREESSFSLAVFCVQFSLSFVYRVCDILTGINIYLLCFPLVFRIVWPPPRFWPFLCKMGADIDGDRFLSPPHHPMRYFEESICGKTSFTQVHDHYFQTLPIVTRIPSPEVWSFPFHSCSISPKNVDGAMERNMKASTVSDCRESDWELFLWFMQTIRYRHLNGPKLELGPFRGLL